MTAALSALETHPVWSEHIDHDKVAALGFFLGETSALSLIGAELGAQSYIKTCDDGGNAEICNADTEVGRQSLHADLAAMIAGFLNRHLGSTP